MSVINIHRPIAPAFILLIGCIGCKEKKNIPVAPVPVKKEAAQWHAPDSNLIASEKNGALVAYGKNLIANTAFFLGPKGTVASISNGMNCQNCHLDAGTRFFGNNYSAVYSTYPKFRARSGTLEDIYKRVNDCMERSLNGKTLDTGSREMQAIKAYIQWVGHDVAKNVKPAGSGIRDIPVLSRAADSAKGRIVYVEKCQLCHGPQGEGQFKSDGTYLYPPLWGPHSYTVSAGLFRLSRFAGYVKDNMPFGTNYHSPQLTDEQAWDVAAFVNSRPRPQRKFKKDWPDISGKPFDHPFGPYADGFSETQHKYGPFEPIQAKAKKAGTR